MACNDEPENKVSEEQEKADPGKSTWPKSRYSSICSTALIPTPAVESENCLFKVLVAMLDKSPYTIWLHTHCCDVLALNLCDTFGEIICQSLNEYEEISGSEGAVWTKIREVIWEAIHCERHVGLGD
jgi:hypothetical protein